MKDKGYYNHESAMYSGKRYPRVAMSYTQFFFRERLRKTLAEMRRRFGKEQGLALLEVGCADGVVMRSVATEFSDSFDRLVGIDTADAMISRAKELSQSSNISFFVRGTEPEGLFDLILELGVLNYTDVESELRAAAARLAPGGRYFLSIAGADSLKAHFSPEDQYQNLLPYAAYEDLIRRYFAIEKSIPCGLYVRGLWRIPLLGRLFQGTAETVFRAFPRLYHEQIYILRAKEG